MSNNILTMPVANKEQAVIKASMILLLPDRFCQARRTRVVSKEQADEQDRDGSDD